MTNAMLPKAPALQLTDINGQPVVLGSGRKLLLSLFREATCPFCNFRVYELTHNYPGLNALGLDMVAVFASNEPDVLKFIAKRPRPFRMVADPLGTAHAAFNVQHSFRGKFKAMMLRMPALLFGMRETGMRGMATGNLMPADILIDEHGNVVETYYGKDAGDHIPMERIARFAGKAAD
ncbi:MAG: redoxin family protein [Gammaproteobacteria bacterium]